MTTWILSKVAADVKHHQSKEVGGETSSNTYAWTPPSARHSRRLHYGPRHCPTTSRQRVLDCANSRKDCKNKSWMSEKDLRLLLSHSWGMNKHMAAWERKTCRGKEGDRRRRCRKCNRNSWGLKSRPQQVSTVRADNEATVLPLVYTFANERLHVNEGNEGALGHEKGLSRCSSDQWHYWSSSLCHSVIYLPVFSSFVMIRPCLGFLPVSSLR